MKISVKIYDNAIYVLNVLTGRSGNEDSFRTIRVDLGIALITIEKDGVRRETEQGKIMNGGSRGEISK